MKYSDVRRHAFSLPEVTEQPHFELSSFRVRGKIFVTVPPGGQFIHVFVADEEREMPLALHPEFVEKLFWGKKVVGLRIALAKASPSVVKALVSQAWSRKAPRSLRAADE